MNSKLLRDSYEAIIIGGGKAGKTLAARLGKEGIKTALIERDCGMIGGACVNIACIPTKSFVQSARVASMARTAASYGIELGDMRIDWLAIRRRVEGITRSLREMNHETISLAPDLDLIIASGRFIGPGTIEIEDDLGNVRRLTGEKIFINTGTRPAELAIPGISAIHVLDSRTVQQLDDLPQHLIIVGGGYVALEFAQMFKRFGSHVTLVVRGKRILPREDPNISEAVRDLLTSEGIEILTDASVGEAGMSATGPVLSIQMASRKQTLSGTHLLSAIGRVPNTESLNLAAAGVDVDDKGYIRVNARLETSAEHVWALGDCNGGPQFTHASLDDFRVVHANVFGQGGRSVEDRLIPATVFIEPELARIGMTETEARGRSLDIRVAQVPTFAVARARTSGQTTGMLKAVVDAKTRRILGCTLFAADAGEMIGVVQMAMVAGLPYTHLRDGILCHPTMTEGFNSLFAEGSFLS